jgi:hypothetical protein
VETVKSGSADLPIRLLLNLIATNAAFAASPSVKYQHFAPTRDLSCQISIMTP